MIMYKISKVSKRLINLAGILIYQLKIQFFFKLFNLNKKYLNDETVILKNQGYLHLKEIIPKNTVDDFFQIYEKELIQKLIDNKEYAIQIDAPFNEKNILFDYLKKYKVFDICKDYLGKMQLIESKNNHQTNIDCETKSMQPHNDTRGNDLKIYICLNDFKENSHPLYYLKGSNNDVRFYILEKHHRRKDIKKDEMDKIYGKKGDVIIFDTHGWHSHTKKNTSSR